MSSFYNGIETPQILVEFPLFIAKQISQMTNVDGLDYGFALYRLWAIIWTIEEPVHQRLVISQVRDWLFINDIKKLNKRHFLSWHHMYQDSNSDAYTQHFGWLSNSDLTALSVLSELWFCPQGITRWWLTRRKTSCIFNCFNSLYLFYLFSDTA